MQKITEKKILPKKTNFYLRRYSEKLLERIHYWVPPVPGLKPLPDKPASSVRIAAIVEERLFRGFRFEAELLILTPSNWRQVLATEEIDFLLVESCWQTITGHWYLGQSFHRKHKEELLAILKEATKRSIPTVYWNTWDHQYHTFFTDFTKAFDLVYCADPKEIVLLNKEGVEAHYLPPAVQPVIHNNRKAHIPGQKEFSINVLYDGFTDIERLGKQLAILEEIRPYGLSIVESQAEVFTSKVNTAAPLLKDCFLGSVTYEDWLTTVKHSNTAVFLEDTLRTKTSQQWQVLESAACGTAILQLGSLAKDDVRHDLVVVCIDPTDLLLMLECFHQDQMYCQRIIEKQLINIGRLHTFSIRMESICSRLGLKQETTTRQPMLYVYSDTESAAICSM